MDKDSIIRIYDFVGHKGQPQGAKQDAYNQVLEARARLFWSRCMNGNGLNPCHFFKSGCPGIAAAINTITLIDTKPQDKEYEKCRYKQVIPFSVIISDEDFMEYANCAGDEKPVADF